MRFMMIVKANKDSEAGIMPSEELLSAMGKYNEELMKAGVLIDLTRAPAQLQGRPHQVFGRQTHRHRRPFRRDQGTDRGLLDYSGEIQGRGDRMGQARPGPPREPGQRNRDPAVF